MGDIIYVYIYNSFYRLLTAKHIPVAYLPTIHLIYTRIGSHMDYLVRSANSLHLDVAIKVAFLLQTARIRRRHKSLRASWLSV